MIRLIKANSGNITAAAIAGVAVLVVASFVGTLWNPDPDGNPLASSGQSFWAVLLAHFLAIPILMVGLIRGFIAAAIASAIGLIGIFVISAPINGPWPATGFVIVHVIPSLYLLWQGLRFAETGKADDGREYYPTGQIIEQMCYAAGAVLIALVVTTPGMVTGFKLMLADFIKLYLLTPQFVADMVLMISADKPTPQDLMDAGMSLQHNLATGAVLVGYGLVIASILMLLMLQAGIAHRSVKNAHKTALRPPFSFPNMKLSRRFAGGWLVLLVLMILSIGVNSTPGSFLDGFQFLIINFVLIGFLPLVVIGMSLIIKFSRKRTLGWGFFPILFLIILCIFGYTLIIVAFIGAIDVFRGWRDRQDARLAKLGVNQND